MFAVLMAVFAFGQSYGILVNGHTYFAGTHVDDFGGYTQYLAHVQVAAGDYCQLYDATNEAAWAVDLDQATIDGFTRNNDRYEVSVSGCYDFYIKMKYGSDQLYIGAGSNCGDGEEIGGGESDQMYVWNGIGTTTADDAIELGGAAEAVQPSGENIVIGAAQKGNWCIKINKKFDNGNYYAGIALDNAVNAGDTVKIAYFRTGASSTYVLGMDFSANKASVATTYQILTQGDPQVLESAGTPADSIFIVPEGVANAKYIRLYRNSGSTGVWIAKFAIAKKSGETPEPEPVDPKTGYALLVNGTDTIDLEHADPFEEYDQWFTDAAELHAGDVVKVYNYDTQAAWAIGILNPASSSYVSNSENGLVFSKDSIYTIYLKLKYELDEVYVAPFDNEGGEVPPVDPTDNLPIVSLAGTMNGWNASANLFVPAQDSLSASLKIELEAGLDSFKIVSDNRWLSLWGEPGTLYKVHRGWPRAEHVNVVDGANFLFEADVTGEYTFTWTYADSTLVVTFPEKGDDPVIDPKTGYALLVVGGDTIDLVHGEEFEGYDQWYTEAAELHAGDVVKVYNYDTQAAWAIGILNPASSSYVTNSENGLVFSKDSIYTIYLKLKYELDEVYVAPFDNEGGDVPPVVEDAKFYIAGTMTDWAANMVELVAGNGDTLSVSIPLEANSLYEFKVVRVQGTDSAWYGAGMDATMHYGNSTDWSLYGDVDVKLLTTKADDYLFIFRNNEAKNISVVIPEPCMGKYGIMLGETFVPAKLNEAQEAWTEYYIDSLELAAGATFTLYDSCALAAWIVNPAYMDEAYAFDTVGAKYTVTMDGIYNLYIKLIPGADELFVNNLSYVAPEPPTPCSGKYGILLGETFVPATRNEAQTEWLEYAIDSIVLAEGATFQLYDSCNGAAWIVNAAFGDEAYAFDTLNNKYVVTMAGAYNLYIKLIPEHDELYVFNRDYVAPEPPTPCNGKYGILLGETFVPATRNEAQTEWLEYAIDSIVLAEGATFQLYDSCNGAAWIVNAAFGDEAYAFDTLNNKYVVTMAGAYNLYIKLIPEHDELYVFNRDYVAPEPEKHYMVYGEAAVANGEDWNENSDINVMTTTDGGLTYTLTIEGLTLQALPRVYEFKIIEKGNNGIEYFPRQYGANASFHVEEAGIYTITYIYTVATENCVVDLQKTGDFEPTLANGYYLVGNQYNWTPAAERMFAVNPGNEAEMVLTGVTLAADDSLKVVYVENDNIVTWYPENADNYVVDAIHAGAKDIYFRADYQGGEDWYAGCIYIAANEGMAIINTEIEKVAVKQLRNGMVIIRRGDREYTIMGQMVK